MSYSFRLGHGIVIAGIFVCLIASVLGFTQTGSAGSGAAQKEKVVPAHATGGFDVKVTPEALSDKSADLTLGRMSIDKQYHGDLDATGKGEMLTASTSVKGSGVYVAIERVTGTLEGRKGGFAMHHTGIKTRGTPELRITVVPDSGTDQLAGLAGTMTIKIDSGKHSYDLEYTRPEQK
ncbi:MAG: DUF3224 domain-containing protein [Terriglobales bacterium]